MKRAPTLPPTIIDRPIIDRGLSMIAMRVTFSRACARARKKKVILYARANARKCAREKVKRKWKKNAFFWYKIQKFLFPFPQFSLWFFFFCDEENKRRERLCKKRVFSRFEFLRTFCEVYGFIRAVFSTSLSRAVPSQRARAWRGRGSDDVSRSRAKLVFCLGSQILNFHSRARTRFGRPLFF